jgi:ABC-type transporter Mla subunit MlaD
MVTQAPKRSALFAAIGFTLSCIGLMVFVWTQFGGTIPFAPQGYRVSALFQQSGMLVPGADVRISGVNVGRVASISNRGLDSFVTMDIDPPYVPLPADTRAILREKTLLGEGYVELSAGTRPGPTLPDGATIPSAHVASTQTLDEVLGSFDKQTQQNFEAFLDGTAVSLAGQGQNLSSALGNLDPTLTELTAMVGVLDEQRAAVRAVISNGATVLTTLGDRSADLRTLINASNEVLSSTAARNVALTATLNALPPFLTQLRTTETTLNGTLGLAKPSLDALKPVAPLVPPALEDVIRLSGPAVQLLHRAPGLIEAANQALPALTRFTTAFKPAIDALYPAAREVVPVISFISLYRQELVTSMANLAAALQATSSANNSTGRASYLRAVSMISSESVYGQSVRDPTNRHNVYFAPGGLAYVAKGGLLSSDCSNTGNKAEVPATVGGNVRCRVQPPVKWGNGILTGYFPHLTRAPAPK